jgi:cell wall-associated NlpC family hydrolase
VLVTYRPPSGAPVVAGTRASSGVRMRQARLLLIGLAAALVAASPSVAAPSSVSSKQAEARDVLAQIQGLDANLEHAVEAYNLANDKLAKIESDLQMNKAELKLAKANLKHAQRELNAHLVAMYTAGNQDNGLEVLLGATSMDDLISRVDTMNRVSDQSADVLKQVKVFRAKVKEEHERLQTAHVQQAKLVAERSAERASIQGQLASRQQMLSSIKDQIAQMQAAEQARQAQLAAQARARLASTGATVLNASAGAITSPQPAPVYAPPPSKYGGVVGIAMQYLGTPYVYGGASPGGFDCSGLVMYVFNQIGVSLPHNAAAQYGYGMPVSRDQLQAGDLVFFNGLGHVGIYIGGGQFIHAPHTGDVVKISSLTGWYSSTYVGARRL